MDNFFQPAPINSGPGHLDRLLATWFESNISLAQVAQNLCITFTSLLEYVGRPEVRKAIQQARELMHERYSDTGLELLHEAAQDFKALKGLPENPTAADKDRQRATLNGMRQVAALLAGLTPRRATWPRAPRTNSNQDHSTAHSAPHHAAHPDPTAPDRALDHSATQPLSQAPQKLRPLSALYDIVDDPENPDDLTPPPTRPKGSRTKSSPTSDPSTPAPKKTYPPVQVVNYLANSAPESTTPAQTTAPDRALDHSTTPPLLLHLPPTAAPSGSTAPDHALCHSTTLPLLTPPRARSPSPRLAA
jgi:hypothetical protein